VVEAAGVFYALWHPDRFRNSVIYDRRPGIDGRQGSTLMAHLAHVANRRNVWYVANGWMYSYRYVADRVRVTRDSLTQLSSSRSSVQNIVQPPPAVDPLHSRTAVPPRGGGS
jgi:hypothetical protein